MDGYSNGADVPPLIQEMPKQQKPHDPPADAVTQNGSALPQQNTAHLEHLRGSRPEPTANLGELQGKKRSNTASSNTNSDISDIRYRFQPRSKKAKTTKDQQEQHRAEVGRNNTLKRKRELLSPNRAISKRIQQDCVPLSAPLVVDDPQGRERFNTEWQGYKPNESTRRVTWRVIYTPEDEVGHILFYGHCLRYGGPFCFLSNFYKADFKVKEWPGHKFTSVEHMLQFCKAFIIGTAEERFTEVIQYGEPPQPLSSRHLARLILAKGKVVSASVIAEYGRAFSAFRKSDPRWWNSWAPTWDRLKEDVLRKAIYAKFEGDWDLKRLMMQTGSYRLYEASPRDSKFGIGQAAHEASLTTLGKGENMLGRLLEEYREDARGREPQWPHTFNFDYFHKMENACVAKQNPKLTEVEKEALERQAGQHWRDWMESGQGLKALGKSIRGRLRQEERAYKISEQDALARLEKLRLERRESNENIEQTKDGEINAEGSESRSQEGRRTASKRFNQR
ncbi:hypothetical protein AC578_10826 [Pseudocercospora eumusae]|uniref:NADAR domain-containing protein n=1 Tax=Pseudocercospora eumusae TaxID=321146 RepID=A0A139GUB1_9PEZI|nr:hypothetical protein AC578_10826 [Pseudocercospora eumusae]